jgi:predicted 3-demethylubiquinone-9 3-methyltransferase (glyoxalase superfamily)
MTMTHRPIVPCLWFDDEAERVADFYTRTFPDGRITAVSHYPESTDNPGHKPRGSVLTVEIEIMEQRFTLLNGGPDFARNPSVSFFVPLGNAEEVERLFGALAEGGEVMMALGAYPFNERYGWVKDRFGVSWQVMVQAGGTIAPCLLFTGPQQGRAEEALRHYASIFPGGKVTAVERYSGDEGPASQIKHGRVVLDGQELVAMDSHLEHGFTFNEGISLQVLCDDQDEVDRYWEALSQGGEQGVCGWLKDRFGVSWQVVPRGISDWMSSEDVDARDRAFEALMVMRKPDVAALQAAFQGR